MFVKKISMMTTIPFLNLGKTMRAIFCVLMISLTTSTAFGASRELKLNNDLPACSNVTSAGTISGTQTSCGSFYPDTIVSLTPASGGVGPVEYQWMYKNASTSWNLTAIPGATSESYKPGLVSETTKFRRCARNQGCTNWPGETSDVTITVTNVCCNVTVAGSISGDQSSCGAFDPAPITSNAPASGGSNNPEYVWMYKNASNGWNFTAIPGTNSETYDPGLITETTIYRRCARNAGCTNWPGETNDITMTVNPSGPTVTASSTNAICSDTTNICEMTDYNGSRTIWLPSLGGTSGVSLFTIVNNSAKLYQFSDGTAHYTGKAQKTDDPNKEWVFSIWFKDKKNWTDWSAGGGSYKNGGGLTNAHLNWDYYIMDNSKPNKMVGLGDFAGVELDLTHRPSNYQYAMQLGTGANDQDGDYGMSFWFDYTSSSSAYSSGHGDFNADAPTCNDIVTCGGTASASVSGGTAPFAYEWSTGVFGDELKGVCTGTYTVTVTDANGCSSTGSTTISTTVCCNDINSGTIGSDQSNCGPFDPAMLTNITPASNGSGTPIEYVWIKRNASTGNSWVTIPGETSLTYDPGTVSETTDFRRCARNQGCTPYIGESNIITVTIYPGITATAAVTNVSTEGASDGAIDLTVSGGLAPYSYLWSNGATTEDLSSLFAGVYSILVSDANGCTDSLDIVILTQPSVCDGFRTQTQGGWGQAAAGNNNGAYRDANFSAAFPSGLTVGCTTNHTIDLSSAQDVEDFLPSGSTPSALTQSYTNPGTTYNNVLAGQVVALSLNIGFDDYDANFGASSTLLKDLTVVSGTFAGQTVQNVLDEANSFLGGCGSTYTASQLNAAVTAINENFVGGNSTGNYLGCSSNFTLTLVGTNVDCTNPNAGTVDLSVNGGESPYTYSWSNGASTEDILGLSAGWYTVTVTDNNGLTATDSIEITGSFTKPTVTVNDGVLTCNSPSVVLTASSTEPNLNYVWSTGATTSSITVTTTGVYSVTVTNTDNGCDTTVMSTVTTPTLLTSTSTSTDVTCNGGNDGSASMAVSGGTAPYTYSWDNGATTSSISGLAPGTYVGTATDANGCTTVQTVTIAEPTLLTSTSTSTDVTCNGDNDGSASMTASGGTAPYTYSWDNGATTSSISGLAPGTYVGTATDANGCTTVQTVTITEPAVLAISSSSSTDVSCNGGNDGTASVTVTGGTAPYTYSWSNGATTASLTGLSAGTYTGTITDANGCTTSGSVTINEPTLLTSTSTSTDVTCNGDNDGTASMTASGGTAPYTYSWDNGATTSSISGLAPGTYVGTATDANGCATVQTVTITEPTLLTSTSTSTDITCHGDNDGSASMTASGGTSPYTYSWDNGATTASISGLAPGTYVGTATDANGCTTVQTVTITEPAVLAISSSSSTDVSCNGGNDGTASVTVTGGTAPYTYSWSNGATTASLTGLSEGTYTGTITDANGCTTSGSVTINEPTLLTSTSTSTDVTCNGDNDGSASMTVSGGTAPYTYSWDNGATTASISGLAPGTYVGTATDANGCTTVQTVTITEPTLLTSTSTSTDITCNGDNDGSASMTASGGTAPYTYSWDNGATTSSISGLAPGTYVGTATDANGCTTVQTVTITEPTLLTSTSTSTDVTCHGDNDGSASMTASGGTAPYTYSWDNGATTSSISGLAPGTYVGTATDANGCTTVQMVTITEPTALTSTVVSTVDATGAGASDGSATVSASGGTAPYTYLWSDGQTTATATGLSAGTYTVTITDANGCTTSEILMINEPGAIMSIVTSTDVSCHGGNDGTATITVSGGVMPYTYLWSNGGTTATITGLVAGTYTVTATDANGYTTTGTAAVVNEPTLLTSTSASTDITCNGDNDGSASMTVSGGTTPYTYSWDNGATTASISGLAPGTYVGTATDANGCTTVQTVTITEPAVLAISSSSSTDVSCNGGNDGTASVTVTGGTAPYTYSWSNGATTASLTGLSAGTYTGTITDANGCTTSGSVTINEPATLVISSSSSTDVSCHGGNDGTASVTVTGGTAPYTYSWNNGATTASLTGLSAGTYTGTITDANGCTTSGSVTINEPTLLTSTSTSTDVTCNGDNDGSASMTASGGTAPYTYSWDNGATTSSISGLAPGTYVGTATDANGCTTVQTVTITEPTLLTSTSTSTDVTCHGDNDGSASMTASGGTAPYTYSWDNGATTSSISGLAPGTYVGTATDANGCTTVKVVIITEPTALTSTVVSTVDATGAGASDGSATVSASGGTAPYTYLWSDGQTTATATGLSAGTYTVTITDANGCTTSETVTINEPAPLTSVVTSTDVSCHGGNDGTATITVSGGVMPYTYLWSNGGTTATITGLVAGTYTVTATDANGYTTTGTAAVVNEPTLLTSSSTSTDVTCNGDNDGTATMTASGGTAPYTYSWDNGATTSSISGLAPGTYVGTATDANGCTTVQTVTITEPTLLTSTSTSTDVTCNGDNDGSASMTASGGTTPYTYSWDNGATTSSISGLAPGTYVGTATDANGCTTVQTVTITEPTLLTSTSTSTDVTCHGDNDGSASMTASGGTAPYTYSWDNGATTSSISGLAPGTYVGTATDANGCTTVQTVTITEPTLLTSTSTSTDVTCHGDNDGSASMTASGGTAPYTYSWDNGATTASISGLAPGTYVGTATDANGCTTVQTVTITEPTLLTSTSTSTDVTCNGDNDGSASMTVSGGTAPYTYSWDNGATTSSISGLAPGTYVGTATDANGCTTVQTVTITEPTLLTSTSTSTDVTCNGDNDGSASMTASGGTAPYTYSWDNGATTSSISGLAPGTYVGTATDANGCTTVQTVTITEPAVLAISSSSSTDVSCNGGNDGTASVTVTGGTAPYTYSWSNGATTASLTGLSAGTYTGTITDANGCTTSGSVTINEPAVLAITNTNITDADCNGSSTGSIAVTVSGGTMPYTYTWSDGQTTATATGLVAGNYSVTVTDANGCTVSEGNVTVGQPAELATETLATTNVSCFGACDGLAAISIDGGTFPFTYLWSDGQTGPVASGLCPGSYSVTVTDANGCTLTESLTITEPPALVNNSTTTTNVSCNGFSDGSIGLNIAGGTAPYTYLWSDGQTTSTASGLVAGTYSVTVTDANGCTLTENGIVITEPATLANSSTTVTDASCNGSSDGSVSLSIVGGTMPYTYLWSDGQTTAAAVGLSAGSYSVTVTDANGCTISVNTTVNEPTALFNNNTTFTQVSCHGLSDGSITVNVLGGTPPYSYLWSDGQTLATATGLAAGTYSVTATDANGCVIGISGLIMTEPTVLSNGSIIVSNVTCNGLSDGSISLSVSGGTPPYSYLWSDGQTTASAIGLAAGTYSVTVTDANGCSINVNNTAVTEPAPLAISTPVVVNATCFGTCDGSISVTVSGGTGPYTYDWTMIQIDQLTGDGTPNITNLCKGLYSLLVTDANGCTVSIDSIEVIEPSPLFIDASNVTNVSCNGLADGSISLNVFGGTAPYTYLWDDGSTADSLTGLSSGTYSVTVTDANGCSIDLNNIFVGEPLPLANASTSVTMVSCNSTCDGSIQISVTGGTLPYTYLWSDGQTTADATNLCAGVYSVTVTDANGCTLDITNITVDEPTALSAQITATDVQCYTACDGSIDLVISGGTGNYTYSWSNGETVPNIQNLCDGTYTFTVTDANGCVLTDSVVIDQPQELHAYGSSTDASCFGVCDGTGNLFITGGTMPYSLLWSNGDTLNNIDSLCPGSYTVVVTDANNCIATAAIVVSEPAEIQVSFVIDYNAASITATASNGVPAYTYTWNNGTTGNTISNLGNGTYNVTVVDANGCSKVDSIVYVEGGGIIDQISVNVGPNPFVGTTLMNITTIESDVITVEVFDAQGSIIEETFSGLLEAHQALQLEIDGNRLEPGIYLARILASDGSSKSTKLMVLE